MNGRINNQCDSNGNCNCKTGYSGNKCQSCIAGYYGTQCRACNCDVRGASTKVCDSTNGQCRCKLGYAGMKCDVFIVIDCQWSTWGKWSICSQTCGKGLQERKRTKVTNAKNGGMECVGSHKETLSCNERNCPVDCQWSNWSKNGGCTKTCGGGIQKYYRYKLQEEKNGGRPCSDEHSESGGKNGHNDCNTDPCPSKSLISKTSITMYDFHNSTDTLKF